MKIPGSYIQRNLYMKTLLDNFFTSKSHQSCLIKKPNLGSSFRYSTIPVNDVHPDSDTPTDSDMQAEVVQTDIMFFSNNQEENERMEAFESAARKNQRINIIDVNQLLQRAVLRRENRFGPRVTRLLKRNKLYPNVDTFRLLLETYCLRREFGICNTLLDMMKSYSLEETAQMRNILVKGLFESGKHNADAWAEFHRNILPKMLTSDSFVYLLRYGTEKTSSIDMFLKAMKHHNIEPTKEVFVELIDAYSRGKDYMKAQMVLLDKRIPEGWISYLQGALIASMAKGGAIVEAFEIYMLIKTKTGCPQLTAGKILIEQIRIKTAGKAELAPSGDFFEKALNTLLKDQSGEPPSEWVHSCYNVVLYYFQKQEMENLCYYLKDAFRKWPSSVDFTKQHFTDEMFFKMMEEQKPDFGLKLFKILIEEFEPYATPSRKGHQFLLWSLVDAGYKDKIICIVWNKFRNSNLPYSAYDYMILYKKAMEVGPYSEAKDLYDKIAKIPSPDGAFVILVKLFIIYWYSRATARIEL